MSNPIDLYLATDMYETLALSTDPNDAPGALHIASYCCDQIHELKEDDEPTFEEWVNEEFLEYPDEYLSNLKDSILYHYATDTRVYTWLNERGFNLPVLRYDEGETDNTAVPYLANHYGMDYGHQVSRLIRLTLMYREDGTPYVRLTRQTEFCRFIAVEDPGNPHWLVQQWDWSTEAWSDYSVVRSEVYGEPLGPSCVDLPEDENPNGITHRMTGVRVRELEEALDSLSLNGTKHLILPYLSYIGNGPQCGLELNHPSSVYEGEIIKKHAL